MILPFETMTPLKKRKAKKNFTVRKRFWEEVSFENFLTSLEELDLSFFDS